MAGEEHNDAVLSDVEEDHPPTTLLNTTVTVDRFREVISELDRERKACESAENSKSELQGAFNRIKILAHESIKKRVEISKSNDELSSQVSELLKQKDELVKQLDESVRAKDLSRSEIETAAQMLLTGIDKISFKVIVYKNFMAGGLPVVSYGVVERSNEIVEELLKQMEVLSKARNEPRELIEQRNYEIAIEVSQLESSISGLKDEVLKNDSSPSPPLADDDDKTILSSAMNKLSLDRHLDFYTLNESKVDDYMHLQPNITAESRADIIDWLIKIHNVFDLTNETLYLTINIIDRFLAVETISFSEFQCVGATAMHIASKFIESRESDDVLEVHEFVTLGGGAYEHQDVLVMELRILVRLEWKLKVVTLYFFLTCFIKDAQEYPLETTIENMVYFYAELGLMNYETIRFCPSMVAAAAVYAARATLNNSHVWHKTLEKQTGFMEMQVLECAKMLVEFHLVAKDDKHTKEIYKKYSSEKRDAVAVYPPSTSLLAAAVI